MSLAAAAGRILATVVLSAAFQPAAVAAGRCDGPGAGFDGAGGCGQALPDLGTAREAEPPAGVEGAPVSLPGDGASAQEPAPRPSSDLYYFPPEEAAEAARLYSSELESARPLGYTIDSKVPPEIRTQLRDDFAFIDGIQGGEASRLHQQIFGAVDGPSYTKFFESRVTFIGMSSCGGGNAVACVIPLFGPSKMWLTQNYIRFSHPQVSRMMVVFHEARHTETRNGNWPHATCPSPFRDANGRDMRSIWTGALLAGEPACDKTPLGSYASSMIMLKNIQKFCKSCTEKVRADAGLYADDQLNRVTDQAARRQILDDLYR